MNKPFLHRLKARIVPVTQAPKATEEEGQKLLPKAVQVILYTACLHSALYDLMEEMTAIGEYRHAKKRNLNECIHRIGYIHNALHKSIGAHSHYFGRWYNEQLDNAEASIREHILIQPPHRAYSIVRALFRLVEQSNEACSKWRCPAVVVHLPDALKLLDRCEFPVEDKHIDFILQNCIDTKDLTKKITNDKFDKQ